MRPVSCESVPRESLRDLPSKERVGQRGKGEAMEAATEVLTPLYQVGGVSVPLQLRYTINKTIPGIYARLYKVSLRRHSGVGWGVTQGKIR